MPYIGSYCEFFQIVNPFRTNSLFLHQKLMAQAISTAASDRSESVKHIYQGWLLLQKRLKLISFSEFVHQTLSEEIIGDFFI